MGHCLLCRPCGALVGCSCDWEGGSGWPRWNVCWPHSTSAPWPAPPAQKDPVPRTDVAWWCGGVRPPGLLLLVHKRVLLVPRAVCYSEGPPRPSASLPCLGHPFLMLRSAHSPAHADTPTSLCCTEQCVCAGGHCVHTSFTQRPGGWQRLRCGVDGSGFVAGNQSARTGLEVYIYN